MWLFPLIWKLKSLAGVLHRDAGNIPLAIKAYEQCLHIDLDSRNAGQVCKQYWLISRFWDPIIYYCMIWNMCMHHTYLQSSVIVLQNRLLAMNYIHEGEDDELYNAHRYYMALTRACVRILREEVSEIF